MGIDYEMFLQETIRLYKTMDLYCRVSSIKEGDYLKFDSPTFTFDEYISSIFVPIKANKTVKKIMAQDGEIAISKWLEYHQESTN